VILKVGVIGCGVVGSAVADCFGAHFGIIRYDKFKEVGTLAAVVAYADMVFVCVPTETVEGMQNLEPLQDVLTRLTALKFRGPVVVKCTVVPGTMDRMQAAFPDLILVHNPEFLTEANARKDFVNQNVVLISGEVHASDLVKVAYRKALPRATIQWYSDFKVTELGKYVHNCFLATKVAFMNEIYDYAKSIGAQYELVAAAACSQGVIGTSHMKVPGPDGKRGYGGMCFPKDTTALVNSVYGGKLSIIQAVIKSNDKIRNGVK
jgi:UDPglucose 6-dehydrogenase